MTEEPYGRVLDPDKPFCPDATLPDELQPGPAQELVLPCPSVFELTAELAAACEPLPAADAEDCDAPLATQGSPVRATGS